MKGKVNVNGLKLAILTMSVIQMATNACSAILADLGASFPEASVSTVQYLMTFPNLMVVIVSFFISSITKHISKRTAAAFGLLLACLAGILSWQFHGNLLLLYMWAGMLGVGIGIVIPTAASLISDYFSGEEKDSLMGLQTAAANAGSMVMTALGGVLASWDWSLNYLVYLLGAPGLILTLLFVPSKNISSTDGRGAENRVENHGGEYKKFFGIESFAWKYFVIAALFMLLFYIGPTNVSMLVAERELGSAASAGMAATLLLLGGFLMGLVFGKLAAKIGENTIPLGFMVLFVGFGMVYLIPNMAAVYIAFFIVGTGNSLVLPQCMGRMAIKDKARSTFLISAVFAVANLGTFLAPALTAVAQLVTGNDLAASRFLVACILALVLAVGTKLMTGKKRTVQEAVQEA